MKEDHLIRISGSMEADGQEPTDTIELMTRGSYMQKGGNWYITYEESETTGYAGRPTTLKIAANGSRVAMLRFGPAPSQLIIEKGTRHLCHYETGFGSMTLGVSADEIRHDLTAEGGTAEFSYVLDSGNEAFISRNAVRVTVSPVR